MQTLLVDLIGVVVLAIFAIIGYFLWDRRYRGHDRGTFRPTAEVFKDPTSGKMTRVYEDPATGQRQYREEP